MNLDQIFTQILTDVKIELHDEFDKNFERKAFFDQAWPKAKLHNNKGSLMARTNNLRRGQKSAIQGGEVIFSNSMPYASIHNEGGEITVTEKMKRFFWAMTYKAAGAITKRRDGTAGTGQRNQRLTAEAQQWKALALQKVGAKMKIEKRQFVGWHQNLEPRIETIINNNLQEFNEYIQQQLR